MNPRYSQRQGLSQIAQNVLIDAERGWIEFRSGGLGEGEG
jgi:hypothetical protein